MKIIAYGARVDEIQYFKQWAKETGNTLEYHTEFLDEHTVEWAKALTALTHYKRRHTQLVCLKNARIWHQVSHHPQCRNRQYRYGGDE